MRFYWTAKVLLFFYIRNFFYGIQRNYNKIDNFVIYTYRNSIFFYKNMLLFCKIRYKFGNLHYFSYLCAIIWGSGGLFCMLIKFLLSSIKTFLELLITF